MSAGASSTLEVPGTASGATSPVVSPTGPLTPPVSATATDIPGRPRATSGVSVLSTSPFSTSPNAATRKLSNAPNPELHATAVQLAQEHLETHGDMSPAEYEALLQLESLLPKHHHIHHIVPVALGGTDHIDNYTHSTRDTHKLIRSFPDPFDGVALTAWEVGITKITKAIERARLGGKYKGPAAEALFDRGRDLGREQRKAQQRRESFQSDA